MIATVQFKGRHYAGPASDYVDMRDRVIIPARKEAETIGGVIRYLLEAGFNPNQIMVVTDHCDNDATRVVANEALHWRGQVWDLEREFSSGFAETVCRELAGEYAFNGTMLRGKGTAVYLALLRLAMTRGELNGLAEGGRVFILDADLRDTEISDPVGALLFGARNLPEEVVMVKLGSTTHNENGLQAALARLPNSDFAAVAGGLQWSLGGQVVVRKPEALFRLPTPTRFNLECAHLMGMVGLYGRKSVGQVEIEGGLHHRECPPEKYQGTHSAILAFAEWACSRKVPLHELRAVDYHTWNGGVSESVFRKPMSTWQDSENANWLLPPINSLRGINR